MLTLFAVSIMIFASDCKYNAMRRLNSVKTEETKKAFIEYQPVRDTIVITKVLNDFTNEEDEALKKELNTWIKENPITPDAFLFKDLDDEAYVGLITIILQAFQYNDYEFKEKQASENPSFPFASLRTEATVVDQP